MIAKALIIAGLACWISTLDRPLLSARFEDIPALRVLGCVAIAAGMSAEINREEI